MNNRTCSRAAADTRVAWLQITSWGSSEMPEQDDFPSLGGFSAPGGPAPSQAQPRPTGAWGTGGLTSSKPLCKASVTYMSRHAWMNLWELMSWACGSALPALLLDSGVQDLGLCTADI